MVEIINKPLSDHILRPKMGDRIILKLIKQEINQIRHRKGLTIHNNSQPRRVNPNLKCFNCGQNHHVLDCQAIPQSRRLELLEQRRPMNQSSNQRQFPRHASMATTNTSKTEVIDNRSGVHDNGQYMPPPHLASPAMHYIPEDLTPEECYSSTVPYIVYEEGVILDSGATSHMTGNSALMTKKTPYHVDVMLADGSITLFSHWKYPNENL
jgi:hypothetical protein